MDSAEAESVIVNGVTAWQMLHRSAEVRAGQTVLVHGASGGVGILLVQLARLAGVSVVGTASPGHHSVPRSLGVQPVDYRDPDLAGRLRELAAAAGTRRHAGLLRVHATFYNLWGGVRRKDAFRARLHADLGTVLGLVRDGELTAYVAARFPLTEVAAATELAEAGGMLGKVVLVP